MRTNTMKKKPEQMTSVEQSQKDLELQEKLTLLTEGQELDRELTLFDPKDMPPLVKHEIVVLSPDLAEKYWREYNIYEKQRPTKYKRLSELSRKVLDGRYHGGELALARLNWHYSYDGKDSNVLVMNGQHQLLVSMYLRKPLKVALKEFSVTAKEQLPVLWAQFDQPGGNRTPTQVAGAYSEEFGGWTSQDINLFSSGLALLTGTTSVATTDEKIANLLLSDYYQYAGEAKNLIYSYSDNFHMKRKAVVAVMLLSLKEDRKKATQFWKHVNSGQGCGVTENYLRDYLRRVSVGNSAIIHKYSTGTQQFYENCLQAWNAYKNGQELKSWRRKRKKKKAA